MDFLTVIELEGMKPYSVGGSSAISSPARTSSPNAVKVFANWYLSKNGQAAYAAAANTPSARLDLTDVTWPTYIEIGTSEFADTYNEDWMNIVKKAGEDFIQKLNLE